MSYRRHRTIHSSGTTLGVIGIAVILALMGGCSAWYAYGTEETVAFIVTDKERVRSGKSDKYLIFTKGETFECSDSLWHGKFDSSDIYGRIREGKSYRARVYGWRIPWLSQYRNIIDAYEGK